MEGDRVRVRVSNVGRDDGRHDDALGGADDSHVRPCSPTDCSAGATRCSCLVRYRLFPCVGAFALLATLVQWALERTAYLDFSMATTSKVLGGFLFVAAGAYEWTRLKEICLTQCQKPFEFVMSYGGFRPDARGSLTLGLRHGAYCVGCCWALITPLFVDGADGMMSVRWVLLLALVVLLEKVAPFGHQIALVAGVVIVAGGAWLLFGL